MSTPRAGLGVSNRRYDPSVVAAILAETDKHLSSIGRSGEYMSGIRSASPAPSRGMIQWLPTPVSADHNIYTTSECGGQPVEHPSIKDDVALDFSSWFDVTTALLKQQETLDGLTYTMRNIKSIQDSMSEDMRRELQAWLSTADQRLADNITLCQNEITSIREEVRQQKQSLDQLAGFRSDAESLVKLKSTAQDLRKRMETLTAEMRDTKVALREAQTIDGTHCIVNDAVRDVEDALRAKLSEDHRDITESMNKWQKNFERSKCNQIDQLEGRLREMCKKLVPHSELDHTIDEITKKLDANCDDMYTRINDARLRIDKLSSEQAAFSSKLAKESNNKTVDENIKDKIINQAVVAASKQIMTETNSYHERVDARFEDIIAEQKFIHDNVGEVNKVVRQASDRISGLEDQIKSNNSDSQIANARQDNSKLVIDEIREAVKELNVALHDTMFQVEEHDIRIGSLASTVAEIHGMLREFVEAEKMKTVDVKDKVDEEYYEEMLKDFYEHIEHLRKSIRELRGENGRPRPDEIAGLSHRLDDLNRRLDNQESTVLTSSASNGEALGDLSASDILERIQVVEVDGNRVQARIREEDDKIGIQILLSETGYSDRLTTVEGQVKELDNTVKNHEDRLGRIENSDLREDRSPGDFTKNEAEHFVDRLSRSVADEIREERMKRVDFDELSGLTSPVAHQRDVTSCDDVSQSFDNDGDAITASSTVFVPLPASRGSRRAPPRQSPITGGSTSTSIDRVNDGVSSVRESINQAEDSMKVMTHVAIEELDIWDTDSLPSNGI